MTHISAYLGLGSNEGDSIGYLMQAVSALDALAFIHIYAQSDVVQSSPIGPQDQPDFYNMCLHIGTSLSPFDLLKACQDIECSLGRVPTRRWGERVIDIDVLIVDDLIINHPDLTIPHSQLHHRLFVLKPLMQLCPNLVVPAKGQLSYLYDCLIQADSSQVVVNRGALETFTTH